MYLITLYSGFPSIIFIFWIRVFAISTGIDAAVVTRPEIMLAQKCKNMPSLNHPKIVINNYNIKIPICFSKLHVKREICTCAHEPFFGLGI